MFRHECCRAFAQSFSGPRENFIKDQKPEEIEMTSCTREPTMDVEPRELIRISIVDDDENYRFLMKNTIDRSGDLECVGSYKGGLEALKDIPRSASEAALMHVRMPNLSGTDCSRQLRKIQPQLV